MKTSQIILNQLGANKFVAMTGAHSLSDENGALVFKFARSKNSYFACKIQLNGRDLYDVTFYKWAKKSGLKCLAQDVTNDVFCEDLQKLFTEKTGLYTSLQG